MASPAKIREALIKLMGAKKANREVMGGQGIPATLDDLNSAELGVRQARQQAREVQGVDPLTTKAANIDEPRQKVYQLQQFEDDAYGQEGMVLKDQKGFNREDAITRGTGSEVTTTRSDPFGGPDYTQKTILDDIEGAAPNTAYPKLIEEFEQLVGRSPTPDEINNRPLMERIVQSIKGPRKTPTEDDIPF